MRDDLSRDREEADRRAEESDRRHQLEDLERFARTQPQQPGPRRPDPVHVLRISLHDQPGTDMYLLARWSLIARLRRDAAGSGDTLDDLGDRALLICQAAQRGDFAIGDLLKIGYARDGKWLQWLPPAPVEPVPGSTGERGQAN